MEDSSLLVDRYRSLSLNLTFSCSGGKGYFYDPPEHLSLKWMSGMLHSLYFKPDDTEHMFHLSSLLDWNCMRPKIIISCTSLLSILYLKAAVVKKKKKKCYPALFSTQSRLYVGFCSVRLVIPIMPSYCSTSRNQIIWK